jgi:hypothetical protein
MIILPEFLIAWCLFDVIFLCLFHLAISHGRDDAWEQLEQQSE